MFPVPSDSAIQQKSTLRSRLRQVRADLPQTFREGCAEHVAKRLATQPIWKDLQSIGLYSAIGHEVDCYFIARAAWESDKAVYLPCVRNDQLEFRPWTPDAELVAGAYGIAEPNEELDAVAELDLLITPLLGWSASGQRLGMGGGYYDRLLSSESIEIGAYIGLAYECQRADEIDECREPWDMSLQGVLTEVGFYEMR